MSLWYAVVFVAGVLVGGYVGILTFFTATEIAWTLAEWRQHHDAPQSHA